jgi:D,D-heptose 1,7-bisphosphate phosphatase
MSNKAVFMDRDRTLIEDPGYLNDPSAVKLLPGVELAIKSLKQAGYLIVIATNQSGIARGLITEQSLEAIHAELRRQLGEKGAHVDGIYYCPYHPEGTVDAYAIDSELRKPKPGMLLKAASELEIDLAQSWMIGDSAHDVEAGQRAGCRTIRIRTPGPGQARADDEDVQADYVVRNLVEAAKLVLRAPPLAAPVRDHTAAEPAEQEELLENGPQADATPSGSLMSDRQVRLEILRHVRQFAQTSLTDQEEFSITKLIAGIVQVLALLSLLLVLISGVGGEVASAQLWAMVAIALQVMALTFFMMQRSK